MTARCSRPDVLDALTRVLLSYDAEDAMRLESLGKSPTPEEIAESTLLAAELRSCERPVIEERLAALVQASQKEDS